MYGAIIFRLRWMLLGGFVAYMLGVTTGMGLHCGPNQPLPYQHLPTPPHANFIYPPPGSQ